LQAGKMVHAAVKRNHFDDEDVTDKGLPTDKSAALWC
jgi:hypothetical protein